MPSEQLRTRLNASIDSRRDRANSISQQIHDCPELMFEEFFARDLLTGELRAAGFDVESGVAGMETAFVARIGTGSPTIAMLCEYDALPEIGHGCGHNLIAAGGLLAGLALADAWSGDGSIQVIGTPAEEGGGGKILELEAGVFDGVDAALMFHPTDHTRMIRHASASQKVTVEYHGKSAHAAASPHEGRSALAAVIQLFTGVDSMRQYIPETARIHGIIINGGSAANVVPEYASAEFQLRDMTQDSVRELVSRFTDIARGAALSTGTTLVSSEETMYTERKNNHAMAFRVGAYLDEAGVPVEAPVLSGGTGSSDVGNVSLALPTIHPYLKIMPTGTSTHSRQMAEWAGTADAFDATVEMARALAYTAADLLEDPGFLHEVVREFDERGPDFPTAAS